MKQLKERAKEVLKKAIEKSTIAAAILGFIVAGLAGLMKEDVEAIKEKYCKDFVETIQEQKD